MEIGVAAVLEGRAGKRLLRIISPHVLRRAEEGRAGVNQKMDVAFEANGAAQISPSRQNDGAATRLGAGLNGLVDGGAVERFAIAGGAEGADIVERAGGRIGWKSGKAGQQRRQNKAEKQFCFHRVEHIIVMGRRHGTQSARMNQQNEKGRINDKC